jgi:hypothetical protein
MGNIAGKAETLNYKELTEEQLKILLNNTAFDRDQILDWHKGFLVIKSKFTFESTCRKK